MTSADILKALIAYFKAKDAVDPNLTDIEISELKLPALPYLQHLLGSDPDLRKDDLFQGMKKALANAFPGVNPVSSPDDKTIFDLDITVADLSANILDAS